MNFWPDMTFFDWWIWNQIPVINENFLSGILYTALTLYLVTKNVDILNIKD